MPQLAPLNWIFLILFFWSMVIYIMISFWWIKSKHYTITKSFKKDLNNKKSWAW
uniref:ATP synthase F0 subunit 8 n=1 Tax=Enoplochiton echinatus TaxID=3244015 RepID=A0A6H1PH15_9MOLL|nr:ATP synthase F0 subunit 8 [Acanthopleura echinata]